MQENAGGHATSLLRDQLYSGLAATGFPPAGWALIFFGLTRSQCCAYSLPAARRRASNSHDQLGAVCDGLRPYVPGGALEG